MTDERRAERDKLVELHARFDVPMTAIDHRVRCECGRWHVFGQSEIGCSHKDCECGLVMSSSYRDNGVDYILHGEPPA